MAATIECKVCGGKGSIPPLEYMDIEIICQTCKGSGRVPLPLNPWHPITDPVALKHLGKLGEEATELATAVLRCIIQGVDEKEPVTGKVNRDWLRNEMADVLANIYLVEQHFGIERDVERIAAKVQHLSAWHKMA
jgi:hypothetical protein